MHLWQVPALACTSVSSSIKWQELSEISQRMAPRHLETLTSAWRRAGAPEMPGITAFPRIWHPHPSTHSPISEAARMCTVVMLVPLLSCLQPHVLNSLSRTGEGCSPERLGTAADTRSFRVWLLILSEGKTTQSQTNALVKYVLSESDLRCSCCTHTKW